MYILQKYDPFINFYEFGPKTSTILELLVNWQKEKFAVSQKFSFVTSDCCSLLSRVAVSTRLQWERNCRPRSRSILGIKGFLNLRFLQKSDKLRNSKFLHTSCFSRFRFIKKPLLIRVFFCQLFLLGLC